MYCMEIELNGTYTKFGCIHPSQYVNPNRDYSDSDGEDAYEYFCIDL
jgi:hypothetical protein